MTMFPQGSRQIERRQATGRDQRTDGDAIRVPSVWFTRKQSWDALSLVRAARGTSWTLGGGGLGRLRIVEASPITDERWRNPSKLLQICSRLHPRAWRSPLRRTVYRRNVQQEMLDTRSTTPRGAGGQGFLRQQSPPPGSRKAHHPRKARCAITHSRAVFIPCAAAFAARLRHRQPPLLAPLSLTACHQHRRL